MPGLSDATSAISAKVGAAGAVMVVARTSGATGRTAEGHRLSRRRPEPSSATRNARQYDISPNSSIALPGSRCEDSRLKDDDTDCSSSVAASIEAVALLLTCGGATACRSLGRRTY